MKMVATDKFTEHIKEAIKTIKCCPFNNDIEDFSYMSEKHKKIAIQVLNIISENDCLTLEAKEILQCCVKALDYAPVVRYGE